MKKQSEVTNFSPSYRVFTHRYLGGYSGICLVIFQPSKANSFLSLEWGAIQMLRVEEQPLLLLTRGLGDGGTGRIPSVSGVGMAVPDEMRFLCRHNCSWETRPIWEEKWTTPKWSGDWKPGIKSCKFTQTQLSLSGVEPQLWHGSARPVSTGHSFPLVPPSMRLGDEAGFFLLLSCQQSCGCASSLASPSWLQEVPNIPQGDWCGWGILTKQTVF